MTTKNKQLVETFIQDLFTRGDPDAVDRYLDPQFVNHDPPFRPAPSRANALARSDPKPAAAWSATGISPNAGEQRGGRLDPPMLLVLDEVANICRIADLPEQYSHLGSRSIVPIAILQSYAQGERVWGKAGMRELWGASTIKLIGSGADDADFAENISRIIGDHEINTVSLHHGPGGANRSISTRRDRILPAADLRALPKSQAVLLATGTKPALIELLPWYRSRRAERIEKAVKTATGQLVDRAEPGPGRIPA